MTRDEAERLAVAQWWNTNAWRGTVAEVCPTMYRDIAEYFERVAAVHPEVCSEHEGRGLISPLLTGAQRDMQLARAVRAITSRMGLPSHLRTPTDVAGYAMWCVTEATPESLATLGQLHAFMAECARVARDCK